MISFRSPPDVSAKLDTGETLTGKDRTFLIVNTLRKYLPQTILIYEEQYRQEMAKVRAAFLRDAQATGSVPTTGAGTSSYRKPKPKKEKPPLPNG